MAERSFNRLTERKIRAFIAQAGSGAKKKLSDGGGLFLFVSPTGTASWRIKYRFAGVERVYTVGTHPVASLGDARIERDRVKGWLLEGADPLERRRQLRETAAVANANTFRHAAQQWLTVKRAEWSDVHFTKTEQALERDVFPKLGDLPIDGISKHRVRDVVTAIVARGRRETAAKVLWNIRSVFDFADIDPNPATSAKKVLPKAAIVKHFAAITTKTSAAPIDELRAILRQFEQLQISPAVRMAHLLCAYTAQRIANVVAAQWEQFDLTAECPTMTIPRAEMKVRDRSYDHVVYLGPTITAELRRWQSITWPTGYLFLTKSGKNKQPHISRESLEKIYRVTLGIRERHSLHGWRASLTSLALGPGGFKKDVTDFVLDHLHGSETDRAYDRDDRKAERVRLARWWDGQLSGAGSGA